MSVTACDPKKRVAHRILEEGKNRFGNRPILQFEECTFGYGDFDDLSNRAAAGLQQMGIDKGDKVALMLPNCPEYLFLWFGLSKLGAVAVPLNTAHKGDILTYMLTQSDSRALAVGGEYIAQVEAALKETPRLLDVITFSPSGERRVSPSKSTTRWEQLIDNSGSYRRAEVFAFDPLSLMYTSGTTGPSKGVVIPQNHPCCIAEIGCEMGKYSSEDAVYVTLPLFHVSGQFLCIMPSLLSGARIVLTPRFSASRFWDDIRRHHCTRSIAISSMLPILFKAQGTPHDRENPLEIMLTAGAPRGIVDEFEKRFAVNLVEFYGMTEVGIPLTSGTGRKTGSCGKPVYGYMVKIVDEYGCETGPNTVGELLMRSAHPFFMMLEYYKMPEKTVEAWKDLWFHTGDYFYSDDDGYFYFVDRKKDAFRRRGENVSSYEVERIINAHPAVLESAAVAVKSDLGEDDILVCLSLKPGSTLSPKELWDYCRDRMAYFMVPRYLRFMTSLPKTATERVQKFQLREEGVTSDVWDIEKAYTAGRREKAPRARHGKNMNSTGPIFRKKGGL